MFSHLLHSFSTPSDYVTLQGIILLHCFVWHYYNNMIQYYNIGTLIQSLPDIILLSGTTSELYWMDGWILDRLIDGLVYTEWSKWFFLILLS